MAKNKPAPTDDEDELDAQIDAALNEAPT